MKYIETTIPEVLILEPTVYGDSRGFFMETFRQDEFESRTNAGPLVQHNHSLSTKNALRGLHYQMQQPQGKLVRVVSGEVFDVAVDMRQSSPTFGKWVGERLSSENKRQLWVPKGFAHGFYVLSESAEFVYACSDYYHPDSEVSLLWDDPSLNIRWPIDRQTLPMLSKKDADGKSFEQAPKFL